MNYPLFCEFHTKNKKLMYHFWFFHKLLILAAIPLLTTLFFLQLFPFVVSFSDLVFEQHFLKNVVGFESHLISKIHMIIVIILIEAKYSIQLLKYNFVNKVSYLNDLSHSIPINPYFSALLEIRMWSYH